MTRTGKGARSRNFVLSVLPNATCVTCRCPRQSGFDVRAKTGLLLAHYSTAPGAWRLAESRINALASGAYFPEVHESLVALIRQNRDGVRNHVFTCAECGKQWTIDSNDELECFFVGLCFWCITRDKLSHEEITTVLRNLCYNKRQTRG